MTGALANMAACSLLLLLRLEGLICVMMAIPLAVPLGMLGAWLAYAAAQSRSRIAPLALLPFATLPADLTGRPETFRVTTSVEAAAPPGQVWRHVAAFTEIAEPREGYFRARIAYPQRARIEGTTWYRHGIRSAAYWRLWSDAIIHRIHRRVLNHVARRAEGRS